jgi:ribosomal-protein-alanine N-acetyltransferase
MSNVILRPVIRSDAAELIEANIASREHHAPWVQPCTDMEGFENWFGQSLTGPNRSLVARHGETGEIVGVVNISQIVWGVFRSAYVSYYGMIGYSRRGLMTEAVRLVVAYAFDTLGLHRLEANIQPGNLASLALVQRAGFRKEGFSPRYLKVGGVWCDHERWALLADEL